MIRILLMTMSFMLAVSCKTEAEQERKNATSCLSAYITTPCALLSKAEVAEYSGATPGEIEMEVPEEIPLDNVVNIGDIVNVTFTGSRFDN